MSIIYLRGSIFSPIQLKTAGKISQLSLKIAHTGTQREMFVLLLLYEFVFTSSSLIQQNWGAVNVSENETKIVHKHCSTIFHTVGR